ncbi:unnamed protein product [Rotaria sp. Silwood2]|nr:unnamed protein product [Rotaria sp. Silwood2]CAF3199818.1 unnamed protein product [Rotaria sp. Silwood2]CAF3370486.1 unnamed protein product [Rotaria sp. Silwood2]CAF4521012.1 unnamed protein product [Rotaria sp. Silwood2]CAF4568442.1 unnamed protein product [Rotaria sp. Silwood2]
MLQRFQQVPSVSDCYPSIQHRLQQLPSSSSSGFRPILQKQSYQERQLQSSAPKISSPITNKEKTKESRPQASSLLSYIAQIVTPEVRPEPPASCTVSQRSQRYPYNSPPQTSAASSTVNARRSQQQQHRREPRAKPSSSSALRQQQPLRRHSR